MTPQSPQVFANHLLADIELDAMQVLVVLHCYHHQQDYIPLYAWASAIYSAQDSQCACVGPRVATAVACVSCVSDSVAGGYKRQDENRTRHEM